ncbi:Rrf2 family transcriptional regulator [Vulcanococcus limneticus]|uniref:Rrf2 family transcriptional regulator n=1 Tax=Vulcanococcus limneticus TaxID=2170428 RepID=UPI00398C06A1
MLRRSGVQALRAALELAAGDPRQWRSVAAIASAQDLPAPMLEQLLLQLRRAQLVEARRGRLGGYRLRRPAREIPVAELLAAVGAMPDLGGRGSRTAAAAAGAVAPEAFASHAGAPAIAPSEIGPDAGPPASDPEAQVLLALESRLQRALERELAALSLEELLYDLRSWRETLSNEGGLMLG